MLRPWKLVRSRGEPARMPVSGACHCVLPRSGPAGDGAATRLSRAVRTLTAETPPFCPSSVDIHESSGEKFWLFQTDDCNQRAPDEALLSLDCGVCLLHQFAVAMTRVITPQGSHSARFSPTACRPVSYTPQVTDIAFLSSWPRQVGDAYPASPPTFTPSSLPSPFCPGWQGSRTGSYRV